VKFIKRCTLQIKPFSKKNRKQELIKKQSS
jgi:hypothetical protein